MVDIKRGFVRVLWGIHDHQGRRFYKRRTKIDNDILLQKQAKYMPPFKVFVFGEDNYKSLVDDGFDCIMADKRPIVWDMNKQQFRHKIEAFKLGIEIFDEMIFLDWDMYPLKLVPCDFWDVLGKKNSLQAILRMYHRRKAFWRKSEPRKIPCASFVYIRGSQVTEDIISMWEKMNKPWSEETVMGRYMDEQIGGWKGIQAYWDAYEPDFFVLREGRVFDKELLNTKNKVFDHKNMKEVGHVLRSIKNGKKPDWVK